MLFLKKKKKALNLDFAWQSKETVFTPPHNEKCYFSFPLLDHTHEWTDIDPGAATCGQEGGSELKTTELYEEWAN